MTIYTAKEVGTTLAREDVQGYLTRRGKGFCCGKCGVKVPLGMDAGWILRLNWAMGEKPINLESFPVESRFIGNWNHPKGNSCKYESRSVQQALNSHSNQFSEELKSIYDVLTEHPIIIRGGRWILQE